MTDERFSVFQYFEDGNYEKVRAGVFLDEAMKTAKHYTTSVGARLGMTQRVIVTDGGDDIVFEWKFGIGVVFPRRTDAS